MSLFNKIRYGILTICSWFFLTYWAIGSFPVSAVLFLLYIFFAGVDEAKKGSFVITGMLYDIMESGLYEYKQFLTEREL